MRQITNITYLKYLAQKAALAFLDDDRLVS